MAKYKSFAFTISTKEDIEGEVQKYITKWLKKQDYAYGVIELRGDGVRHAHFQTWHEEPKIKGDLCKRLKDNIAKLCPESIMHRAFLCKLAYNDDYLKYMDKKIEDTLIDNIPKGDTSIYYPTQEEQDKVKKEANAVDKKFHHWDTKFHEWYTQSKQPCLGDVARWMSYAMFKEKSIMVIVDKKNRVQNCKSLYLYINSRICASEFMTEADNEEYVKKIEEEMKDL